MQPNSHVCASIESPTGNSRLTSIILRLYYSPASWSLLDQMIVSGMRFAMTMIVGRFCGPEGLGIYVLVFSVILAVSLGHESLVAKPYQVFIQSLQGRRNRSYTGSTLVQMLGLCLLCALVSILFGTYLLTDSKQTALAQLSLSLAIVFPGILLWEFVRRQAFALLDMRSAVLIDGTLAFLQLSVLLGLGLMGELTVVRTLLLIGFSSALVGLVSLFKHRSRYLILKKRLFPDTFKNWSFGRWFFASHMFGLVQASAVPWLLTMHYTPEKTGILMACQTLVLLSNPFLLGLANWLGPASARRFVSGGFPGLDRFLVKTTIVSGSCMILFALVLLIFGEPLLHLTFGPEYAGNGHLVSITGITAFGFCLTICGGSGLAAIQRARVIMWGTVFGSLVTIIGLLLLIRVWELTGAAWALALGSMTSGLIHLVGYGVLAQKSQALENNYLIHREC